MYCTKKINDNLTFIGANDRKIDIFEGVYSVPNGISYNSYLLNCGKTVLFDTVDKAVSRIFLENLENALNGKQLDYVIVSHVEPDHSATLLEVLLRHPNATVICNAKTKEYLTQFFNIQANFEIVTDGQKLTIGSHEFIFINAPMVHWPEVMMTYDATDKILFSADAFGCFGALNGKIFADQADIDRDFLDEFRRYYTNIVGKYGVQVSAILKKASALEINYICPLHGFVWRKNFEYIIDKYVKWSTYTPEEQGVAICYGSIYQNTENAVEILASKLVDLGVKVEMFDLSKTENSYALSSCFKFSHVCIASPTYNGGIFVKVEDFVRDLIAHNLQNRKFSVIENGTWASLSGKLIKELLQGLKNTVILDESVQIKSALKPSQLENIENLAIAVKNNL